MDLHVPIVFEGTVVFHVQNPRWREEGQPMSFENAKRVQIVLSPNGILDRVGRNAAKSKNGTANFRAVRSRPESSGSRPWPRTVNETPRVIPLSCECSGTRVNPTDSQTEKRSNSGKDKPCM
jgi:hypothetical protein